jgi:hypothetical protein
MAAAKEVKVAIDWLHVPFSARLSAPDIVVCRHDLK